MAAIPVLTVSVNFIGNKGFGLAQVFETFGSHGGSISSADPQQFTETSSIGSVQFVSAASGGGDLSYDGGGHLIGGTIGSINFLDLSGNPLVTSTGFAIAAADLISAFASGNTSTLFGAYAYTETGGGGGDVFYNGPHADNFIGGSGPDRFDYFPGAGPDKIVGFSLIQGDRIDLTQFNTVHSLTDFSLTQNNSDTLLTIGSNVLTLTNFTASSLTNANFIFAPNGTLSFGAATNGFVQKNDPSPTINGQLTTSDSNSNHNPIIFTTADGVLPHGPNYQFAIDELKIVRGTTTYFDDAFTSTTPPAFGYATAGAVINDAVNHKDVLSSANQTASSGSAADPFRGQSSVLQTDGSLTNTTDGLKAGMSFSVSGTFDLVLPSDPRAFYGLELTDLSSTTTTTGGIVELLVTKAQNGAEIVDFREVSVSATGANFTTIQTFTIDPAVLAVDNRIQLTFNHNAPAVGADTGEVDASFSLIKNDGSVDSTTNFTHGGSIFVGDSFTRAGFFAGAPKESDVFVNGTYGVLDVTQSGAWQYSLANSRASVQALAQGQSATDAFSVQAVDNQGISATVAVTPTVYGANPSLAVTVSGSGGAAPKPFDNFFGFGDSTIDSGYFFNTKISNDTNKQALYDASKAAGGGIPTSIGGAMSSTLLAQDFGLTATPSNTPGGGTNYAASGATSTDADTLSGSLAPSIVSQIESYLSTHNQHADANALYLFSGGGNDQKTAAKLDPVSADAYMKTAADAMAAELGKLHADGAKYLLLKTTPGTNELLNVYNNELWSQLTADGVPFLVGDAASLVKAIRANPSAYGITDTVKPAVGPFGLANPYNSTNGSGGADINPSPSTLSQGWALYSSQLAAGASGYLWADDQHLAAAGQLAEANLMYADVLNAKPVIGEVLTASPLLTGAGDVQNVSYQWQRLAHGSTTWVDVVGAIESTYVVQSNEQQGHLRVVASYTVSNGILVSATSAPTFPVAVATTKTWATAITGAYEDGSKWAPGGEPGIASNVIIGATGVYTVNATTDETYFANRLRIDDSSATLQVTNSTLQVGGGVIKNAGTIQLGDSGGDGVLLIGRSTQLTGSGHIALSGGSMIGADYPDGKVIVRLYNVDELISGVGHIGDSSMQLINEASIIGGIGDLVIDTGANVILNTGLGAEIRMGIPGADNTGATIDLVSAFKNAATVDADGFGILHAHGAVTNSGNFTVETGAMATIDGVLNNSGQVLADTDGTIHILDAVINASPPHPVLTLADAAMSSAAEIQATDGGEIQIDGLVTNRLGAVIDADNSSFMQLQDLKNFGGVEVHNFASFNVGGSVTNYAGGTITADTLGMILVNGPVHNFGSIEADATRSRVEFLSTVDNTGGTLVASGGTLTVDGAQSGHGNADIIDDGIMEFGAAANAHVNFFASGSTPTNGSLVLDDSVHFKGDITGFGGTDKVFLEDFQAATTQFTFKDDQNTHVTTATFKDGAVQTSIKFIGDYSAADFTVTADPLLHVLVTHHDQMFT